MLPTPVARRVGAAHDLKVRQRGRGASSTASRGHTLIDRAGLLAVDPVGGRVVVVGPRVCYPYADEHEADDDCPRDETE